MTSPPPKRSLALPSIAFRQGVLQILALWTFAVAQPIYRALGPEIEFFLAHHCQPADVAIFILALSLAIPLTLALGCAGLRLLGTSVFITAHLALSGLLAGVFGLHLAKTVTANPAVAVLLALILATGTAIALLKSESFRRFVEVLSFSVLVCPLLFLNTGRIGQLAMGVLNSDPLLPPTRATAPVIFLIFDEFPQYAILDKQGRVDPARFPNLAALAAGSNWYPYASATCDDTTLSVPAILAGEFPDPARNPLISDYPKNLFTLLGATYKMRVEEQVTRLAPRGSAQTVHDDLAERLRLLGEDTAIYFLHTALPRQLASAWLPPVEFTWAGFARRPENARESRKRDFERFLETIVASEEPRLYFKHVNLPHYPYVYLPSGQEYDNSGAPVCDGLAGQDWTKGLSWAGDWEALTAFQREMLQAVFVDKLVGDLVARLKETGLYDRCLIVLTSDHGASFRGQTPHRLTNESNVSDQLFVPLIIKEPNQTEGRINRVNATSLDILPTVADMLGVSLPWEPQGRSLRQGPDHPQGEKVYLASVFVEKPTLFRIPDWQSRHEQVRTLATDQFPIPGVEGLYRIGPNQELYGKAVARLKTGAPTPVEFEIPFSGLLANVDPQAAFLPVRLKGSLLEYRGARPAPLAIAMHGQIASLSYVMADGRFETIVNPALLRKGDNSVTLYLVEGDVLRPIPEKRRSYSLEAGRIVEQGGTSHPLIPAESLLTSWVLEDQRVTLKGYALPPSGQSVTRLLVFQDDRFICDWPLRPEEALKFERDVPRELLGDKLPRLFVLFTDGSAAELARRESYALRSAVMTSSGGQAVEER